MESNSIFKNNSEASSSIKKSNDSSNKGANPNTDLNTENKGLNSENGGISSGNTNGKKSLKVNKRFKDNEEERNNLNKNLMENKGDSNTGFNGYKSLENLPNHLEEDEFVNTNHYPGTEESQEYEEENLRKNSRNYKNSSDNDFLSNQMRMNPYENIQQPNQNYISREQLENMNIYNQNYYNNEMQGNINPNLDSENYQTGNGKKKKRNQKIIPSNKFDFYNMSDPQSQNGGSQSLDNQNLDNPGMENQNQDYPTFPSDFINYPEYNTNYNDYLHYATQGSNYPDYMNVHSSFSGYEQNMNDMNQMGDINQNNPLLNPMGTMNYNPQYMPYNNMIDPEEIGGNHKTDDDMKNDDFHLLANEGKDNPKPMENNTNNNNTPLPNEIEKPRKIMPDLNERLNKISELNYETIKEEIEGFLDKKEANMVKLIKLIFERIPQKRYHRIFAKLCFDLSKMFSQKKKRKAEAVRNAITENCKMKGKAFLNDPRLIGLSNLMGELLYYQLISKKAALQVISNHLSKFKQNYNTNSVNNSFIYLESVITLLDKAGIVILYYLSANIRPYDYDNYKYEIDQLMKELSSISNNGIIYKDIPQHIQYKLKNLLDKYYLGWIPTSLDRYKNGEYKTVEDIFNKKYSAPNDFPTLILTPELMECQRQNQIKKEEKAEQEAKNSKEKNEVTPGEKSKETPKGNTSKGKDKGNNEKNKNYYNEDYYYDPQNKPNEEYNYYDTIPGGTMEKENKSRSKPNKNQKGSPQLFIPNDRLINSIYNQYCQFHKTKEMSQNYLESFNWSNFENLYQKYGMYKLILGMIDATYYYYNTFGDNKLPFEYNKTIIKYYAESLSQKECSDIVDQMNLKVENYVETSYEDTDLFTIINKTMQNLAESKIYPFDAANYFDGKEPLKIKTILKILRGVCFNMSHPKRSFGALETIAIILNNPEIYNEAKK
ncbi:MAG: MIF4G domain-containing protein [archaeon]|nr:MIF4G domain-containing protein [archaeon]